MKGIIITGAPRSGKSTFVELLLKELKGYCVVNGDAISTSLLFSKNGKVDYSFGRRKIYEVFEKTVLEYPNSKVILDYHYIEEDKLIEYYRKNYEIIFFGYPNITIERLKQRIRKLETRNDWTSEVTPQELNKILVESIEESKKDAFFCKKVGIKYIDTSFQLKEPLKDLVDWFKEKEAV